MCLEKVPGFTANHILNYSNGYASSLATLELEAAVLSPVPTLMIKCEASIFDAWNATSHTLVLRERSANPASALGRSLTGAATEIRLSTILVVALQLFLKFLLQTSSVRVAGVGRPTSPSNFRPTLISLVLNLNQKPRVF
ncbi:hypothetical protein EVAR_64657_1 [Eumeta japonica]|uniref:Uncharacterized protein n=1 Tax=Eumeta variegata TaxID=151549 RepID=A0A4C2A799_EUMVA|nr:hypothetical protein EVAR_64657_1 [Eumeta japonica]